MKRFAIGTASAIILTGSASAQFTAWLPEPRELIVTPSYTFQNFDKFWAGTHKVELDDDVSQHTTLLTLEYGIMENLAADLTVGYTAVSSTDAFAPDFEDADDDGLTDTTFGLRYKFLDQDRRGGWPMWPSMAVRVGGIIEGTYDEDLPFSAGDGASGAEASLLLAKAIGPNLGLFGDVGYRYRAGDVPDDFFGSGGAYFAYRGFTLSGAYRHVQGLDGDDIGDPGFSFPEVKEIIHAFEIGLGYRDSGGRYYQFFYADVFDGRNTGRRDIFGFSASIPFRL
jgi:hypothetical protein